MIDLEALERALTMVEELMEFFEGQGQRGNTPMQSMRPTHARLQEQIMQGLWERFLEARERRPTAGAWRMRLGFEEV